MITAKNAPPFDWSNVDEKVLLKFSDLVEELKITNEEARLIIDDLYKRIRFDEFTGRKVDKREKP